MTDTTLNIIIQARDEASKILKGLGSTLNDAKQSAQNFARQGLEEINKASNAVASQLKLMTAASVAAGIAFVGFSVKSAAEVEQIKAAFVALTGSVDTAKNLMVELNDFAKTTPFQFTQVAKASQNLLAFGIEAENVTRVLGMLGDLSAGNQQRFTSLVNVYGQVRAAGRLLGQDLLQFTSTGIPIIQALADEFGIATEQVKDLVSEGTVGFDDVDRALRSMTSNGGLFFNLMQNESETLNGRISNLQDTFSIFGRDLVGLQQDGTIRKGSIFYYLGIGVENLLTELNKVDVTGFSNALTVAMETLFRVSQPIFAFLVDRLREFQSVAITAFGVIKKQIEPVIVFFQNNLDKLNYLLKGLSITISVVLANALFILLAPLLKISLIVGGLSKLFGALAFVFDNNFFGLKDRIKDFATAINQAFESVKNNYQKVIDFISTGSFEGELFGFTTDDSIIKFFQELREVYIKAFEGIRKFIQEDAPALFEQFKQGFIVAFGFAIDWFKDNWPIISEFFTKTKDKAIELFNSIVDNATLSGDTIKNSFTPEIETLKNVWDNLNSVFEEGEKHLTTIVDLLKDEGVKIFDIFKGVIENLRQPTNDFISALSDLGEVVAPIVFAFLTGLAWTIKNVLIPVFGFLADIISKVFGFILNVITSAIRFITDLLNIFVGTIEGLFTGDFSRATEVFTRIWQGLPRIIGEKIWEMLRQIGDFINRTYEQFYGINLFNAGQNIINSLISGLRSMTSDLKNAFDRLVRETVPDFSGLFNNAAQGFNFRIPGFAGGVDNFSGGLAVVGEKGPELVNLPRGSSVIPNRETNQILGRSQAIQYNFTINMTGNYLGSARDRRDFVRDLLPEIKQVLV